MIISLLGEFCPVPIIIMKYTPKRIFLKYGHTIQVTISTGWERYKFKFE
jgi:TusA-related sulfurtransferase